MRATLIILIVFVLVVGLCYTIESDLLSGWGNDPCPDNDCGSLLDLDDDDTASFDEEEEV